MKLSCLYNENKVYLTWDKVENIDGYRIFKKNVTGEFGGFQSSKTENAIIEGLEQGEEYEFKVKPYILKDGKRDFSTGLSAKCKINTVENNFHFDSVVNEAYDNKIALSWNCPISVDGFLILKNNEVITNINDGLQHILLINYTKESLQVVGYKNFAGKQINICQSNITSVNEQKQFLGESYKLSVIIPVYNSQDYISRTIQTVLGSTLSNIELVLVDDESTDNTRDVIDWYCDKYPLTVKKIYKKNGGVADTRNTGIAFAHGKYIAFMDNDDMVRPDGFQKLFDAIEKTHSDIAVSPLYRIDPDRYLVRHKLPFEENKKIDIDDYLKMIFSDGYNNIGVWNKLYKADLVKNHPYGKLMYEDVSWTPYILSWANSFCYVNSICYEWDRKIRPATLSNTLSNRTKADKFNERFEAFKFFYEQGNPKRRECLAYIMAKRLYGQGLKAKYSKYFEEISNLKNELINNKYLLEDKAAYEKLQPFIT